MSSKIDTTDVKVFMSRDRSKVLTSRFIMSLDRYLVFETDASQLKLKDATGYTFVNFERMVDVQRILTEDRYVLLGDGHMPHAEEVAIAGNSVTIRLNQYDEVPISIYIG